MAASTAARQSKATSVESIARSASTRPVRSTPPEGGESAAVFAANWPYEGHDQREQPFWPARGTTVACVRDQRRSIPGHG
jgi:hypothetical protein